jgi:hypothetical protein
LYPHRDNPGMFVRRSAKYKAFERMIRNVIVLSYFKPGDPAWFRF